MSERKAMRKADTVTLSMAEYRRLLRRIEDAEDLRDLRIAEATATKRDYLPAALVRRILAGEHPVRAWREHRAMTLARLATAAGMQQGYLSEIETGRKPGSVRAYRALAEALGVAIEDLLPAT